MSIGWRRQFETDTLYEFAMMVKLYAERYPQDEHLQQFKQKAVMRAQIALASEKAETQRGDIMGDRKKDCQYCINHRCAAGQHKCGSAGEKVKIINRYFGEEGLHFIRWAGKRIRKLEGEINANDPNRDPDRRPLHV